MGLYTRRWKRVDGGKKGGGGKKYFGEDRQVSAFEVSVCKSPVIFFNAAFTKTSGGVG